MRRGVLFLVAMMAACSRPAPTTNEPTTTAPSLRLGREEPEPPPREAPPALDQDLIAPPAYTRPRDEEARKTVKRIRLPGTSGKQRINVSAKALGKPTDDGLQWVRVHVDAHGAPSGLLTQVAIAVDAIGGHDPARAALAQAAANKLVERLGSRANVSMISLTTKPTGHPDNPMTSGNRGRMLAAIERAGQQEHPAALGPAFAKLGEPNLVIIAAADEWADDDSELARVTDKLETLGLRAQLLVIGHDADTEPFAAVEQVHRASSAAQIDTAVERIIRWVPRTHFMSAGISLTFPEGIEVLGGRRGAASEDNRTAGFQLGPLWTGFRHEADLLVQLDPETRGTQTLSAKIHYTYRNPKPGTSILTGNQTSKVRLRLP